VVDTDLLSEAVIETELRNDLITTAIFEPDSEMYMDGSTSIPAKKAALEINPATAVGFLLTTKPSIYFSLSVSAGAA
jgi:hypothetical protein